MSMLNTGRRKRSDSAIATVRLLNSEAECSLRTELFILERPIGGDTLGSLLPKPRADGERHLDDLPMRHRAVQSAPEVA
jgi:hypothetical protein